MCLSPLVLKRKHRTMQGDFSDVVPCGACVLCFKRRQNAWAFRLSEESKVSSSASFLTLTYEQSPLSPSLTPTLLKTDFQKFLKRLRKILNNSGIKYYACGEYGSKTQRPHYHAVIFNLPQLWLQKPELIQDTWQKGHIYITSSSNATIRYVTKYLMKGKNNSNSDREPEFSLMSKKMGLSHLTPQMIQYYKNLMISHVTLPGGFKTNLPRYFRDKIFTKQEIKILNANAEISRDEIFKKLFKELRLFLVRMSK